MRDFRLPPHANEICVLLRFLDYLSPEGGTVRLSRDACTEVSLLTAQKQQISQCSRCDIGVSTFP